MLMAPLALLPMEEQTTVWFFISLAFCWGCYHECCRLIEIVCREDSEVNALWRRWFPWLGIAVVVAALLPTLNCLQRGQVGIMVLYLLLLGERLVLDGRTYRAWLVGGIVLALPALKIVPLLPAAFLIFLLLVDLAKGRWQGGPRPQGSAGVGWCRPTVFWGDWFCSSSWPAMLVGWRANLHHLDTWRHFMFTKADDGGMDPRSGNSHSVPQSKPAKRLVSVGKFRSHCSPAGRTTAWSKASKHRGWRWTIRWPNGC